MVAHQDGARLGNASLIEIVDCVSNAAMKVIQLITSFHAVKVEQMMTGIFSFYADHAIQAKVGGFLFQLGHPRPFLVYLPPKMGQ